MNPSAAPDSPSSSSVQGWFQVCPVGFFSLTRIVNISSHSQCKQNNNTTVSCLSLYSKFLFFQIYMIGLKIMNIP